MGRAGRPRTARLAALAAGVAAVVAPAPGAGAAEWIGHSAFGNNWSDAANWFLFEMPSVDRQVHFTNLGAARPRPFLDANWTVRSLGFGGSTRYDLQGGSRLTVGAARYAPLTNGIFTDSSVTQNVRFPVRLGNDAVFWTYPGSGQLYLRGDIDTNGHDLLLRAQGGTLTILGRITGAGNLLSDGDRTVVYNASNTYTGYTDIYSGTFVLGHGGRIADASPLTVRGPAVFRMTGQTDAVAGLNGSGTVLVDEGSRLVLGNYSTLTTASPGDGEFTGTIRGTGGLSKRGTGTQFLDATLDFAGAIEVEEGRLALREQTRLLAATDVRVAPGATLEVWAPLAFGSLDGAGGTVRAYGAMAVTGGTFDGTIDSGGTFEKNGPGTLTLGGRHNGPGTLGVNDGTLVLGPDGRVSDAAPLHVAAPATFRMTGQADAVRGLWGQGTVLLDGNSRLVIGNYSALTIQSPGEGEFTGTIRGTGGVSKRGTGLQVLNGTLDFGGELFVEEGRLTLRPQTQVLRAPNLRLAPGATLDAGAALAFGTLNGAGGNVYLYDELSVTGGTFRGTLRGAGSLRKRGPGTLTLGARNTYAGPTTVEGGALAFAAPQRLSSLHIGAGAAAVIPEGASATVVTGSLDIAGGAGAWAGTFDVGLGAAAVDYEPEAASPLHLIADQVRSAYNGGAWDGQGVTSFRADDRFVGVGYAESAFVLGADGGTFAGEAVDGTAVLLRAARYGDADLDGTVDADDLLTVRRHLRAAGETATWQTGDFNYDGRVSAFDLSLLRMNYGRSLPAPAAPDAFAAVPEPAAPAVLLPAAMLLLRRRRRHHRQASTRRRE